MATLGLDTPLDAAVASLAHRGPDGGGTWRSADGLLALGHRRLAVVGGPRATQPVVHDGQAAILNGQLYGWRSLDTVAPGDAGVLLPLYRRHGDELGHHLRGEFALVVADPERRRLVALRDRWGTKPLYLARIGDGVALASELRALIALGVPPTLDLRTVDHAFAHQYPPPSRSFVEGVVRLPAGGRAVVTFDDGRAQVRIDRWCSPRWATEEAVEDDFVDVLDDAVKHRLDSEQPVGALLSGGLDSAAIVDAAWRLQGPLPCFTVRFPGPAHDEGDQAQAFAAARGCPLHAVPVTHQGLLEALPAATAAAEGLCINGQLVARRLLARRVRQEGVVVVLSGEGSDEIGLGYPHLLVDHGAPLAGVTSTHGAQAGVMLPTGSRNGAGLLAPFEAWLGRTPSFLQAKAAFGDHLVPLLHTRPRGVFDDLAHELRSLPAPGAAPVHQASQLWMALCLDRYILGGISDAQDMAEGVESRPPFLDERVWAWARRVPPTDQTRRGVGKERFRSALRRRLGPAADRPKHPFLAPPLLGALPRDQNLAEQARSWVSGLRQVASVNTPRAEAWFDESLRATRDGTLSTAEVARRDAALWTLMSTAALAAHLRSLA